MRHFVDPLPLSVTYYLNDPLEQVHFNVKLSVLLKLLLLKSVILENKMGQGYSFGILRLWLTFVIPMDDLLISSINIVSRLLVFTKQAAMMENPYKSKQVDGAYGEIWFNRYLRAWFDTFYDINNIFKVAQRLEHHGSTLKAINFRT